MVADNHKTHAQLLLEKTSIPADASMWFRDSARLQLVKRGLDIMYSSFAAGYKVGHTPGFRAYAGRIAPT